jgi:hypothetical protein
VPAPGGDGAVVAAGTAFTSNGAAFRTTAALTLTETRITARSFHGSELLLTFEPAVPAVRELVLYVAVANPAVPTSESEHHDVRVAWEVSDGGSWRALDADAGEIEDHTRALTRDGLVVVRPPIAVAQLRRRVTSGEPDNAPALRWVAVNAVTARQAEPFSGQVGSGTGQPGAVVELLEAPVADGTIDVTSVETDGAHVWIQAVDLDAAGRTDERFTLDAGAGVVRFGDGLHGRTVPAGAAISATYEHTLGPAGNVPATTDWAAVTPNPAIARVLSFDAASGGANAETVAHAAGRAAARLWAHERLVQLADDAGVVTLDEADHDAVQALDVPERATTLLDFERLALAVPGTRIARARAFGGIDGGHPGLQAPGTVTVVLVAGLPAARPLPSGGLLRAVRAFLAERRTVGTRLVVCPPTYVEIGLSATLAVRAGADAARVIAAAGDALAGELDPLQRSFGRDVYRSEILELLDDVDGVDHVAALELSGPDGATCGNVCVPPAGLAVAGDIELEVAT